MQHLNPSPQVIKNLSITPTIYSPSLSPEHPLSPQPALPPEDALPPEPALSPPYAAQDLNTEETLNQSRDLMDDTINYYVIKSLTAPLLEHLK